MKTIDFYIMTIGIGLIVARQTVIMEGLGVSPYQDMWNPNSLMSVITVLVLLSLIVYRIMKRGD